MFDHSTFELNAMFEEMIATKTVAERRIELARILKPFLYSLPIRKNKQTGMRIRRFRDHTEGVTDFGTIRLENQKSHAHVEFHNEPARIGRFKIVRLDERAVKFFFFNEGIEWQNYLDALPNRPWWVPKGVAAKVRIKGVTTGIDFLLMYDIHSSEPAALVKRWNEGEPVITSFLWHFWLTYRVGRQKLF